MRSTRRWKSAPNHPWQRPSAVPRPWTPHNNLLHIKVSFWVAGIWVVLVILISFGCVVATPVVTRCVIEKPSYLSQKVESIFGGEFVEQFHRGLVA